MGNKIYDRVLEIGTGSGIFLPEISKHCHELFACDIHNNMEAVKKLCDKYSIQVKLEHCPMENLIFPSNFFDLIIAISVMEFVDNLEKSIDEVKRILKPSGIFVTICPQKSTLLDFVLGLFSCKDPEDEFTQSRRLVSSLLEKKFYVITKNIFPPIIGKALPVYNYYKLSKHKNF